MVYHNPTNAVLSAAEMVMLFDLNVPGWKEVVVSRKAGATVSAATLSVINIPVDSKDSRSVQRWRDRIAEARTSPSC